MFQRFYIPEEIKSEGLYIKGRDIFKILKAGGIVLFLFFINLLITQTIEITDFIIPIIFGMLWLFEPYNEPFLKSLIKTIVYAIFNKNRLYFGKEEKKPYDIVINNNDNLNYQYGIIVPKYFYDKSKKSIEIISPCIIDVYNQDGYRIRKNIKLSLPVIKQSKKTVEFSLPTVPFILNDDEIKENINITIKGQKLSPKQVEKYLKSEKGE